MLIRKRIFNTNILYLIEFMLVLILLIIFSIFVIKSINMKNSNYILINDKRTSNEVIECSDIILKPGSINEETYKLSFLRKGKYLINLDFNDIEDSILKEHLLVKVILNEDVICYSNIDDLLNDKNNISFTFNSINNLSQNLTIIYEIPLSVDNEIQGKTIDISFNLYIRRVG